MLSQKCALSAFLSSVYFPFTNDFPDVDSFVELWIDHMFRTSGLFDWAKWAHNWFLYVLLKEP